GAPCRLPRPCASAVPPVDRVLSPAIRTGRARIDSAARPAASLRPQQRQDDLVEDRHDGVGGHRGRGPGSAAPPWPARPRPPSGPGMGLLFMPLTIVAVIRTGAPEDEALQPRGPGS